MIGWLQGEKIELWKQGAREGVLLNCGGVGYEIQLTPNHFRNIQSQNTLIIWIHQINREDGYSLFGFPNKEDRNLFRALIGVSGVGPQIGLALLAVFTSNELAQAITHGDIQTLSKAQGVGKRTAERLALELRSKLSESFFNPNQERTLKQVDMETSPLDPPDFQELKEALKGLGYEELEISLAIQAIRPKFASRDKDSSTDQRSIKQDTDEWIRESIKWLSKEAA